MTHNVGRSRELSQLFDYLYILMPVFGPAAIRNWFPAMTDIASQLVTKWERFGSDYVIDVSDNMTRYVWRSY